MIHAYRWMAATAAALMLASLATGLGTAEWRRTHVALATGTVVVVLGILGFVDASLRATARQVEATCRTRGLPSWLATQADRNRRRTAPFLGLGAASIVVAAALGAPGLLREGWAVPAPALGSLHLAASGFAMGFGVVAMLVTYAGLAAQRRLMVEMRNGNDGADGGTGRGRGAAEASS